MINKITILILIFICHHGIAANIKTITKPILDGIRFIFWITEPDKFIISQNNTELKIDLGNHNFDNLKIQDQLITSVTLKEGKININASKPIKYRKFISDQYVGLDIIAINPTLLPKTFPSTPTTQDKLINNIIPKTNIVSDKNSPPAKVNSAISKSIVNKSKPEIPLPTKLPKPITTPAPVPKVNDIISPKEVQTGGGVAIPPVKLIDQQLQKSLEINNQPAQRAVHLNNENLAIIKSANYLNFSKNEQDSIITFPWEKPIPAASFNRGGYLYIVFGDYNNPPIIPSNIPQEYGNIEFSSKDGFVIYKLNINRKNVDLIRNGGTWQLVIPIDPNKAKVPTKLKSYKQINDILTLEVPFADKYLEFNDPQIGDRLLILPLSNDMYYINQPYSTTDFELLETSQGIAIVKNNDQFKIDLSNNKIKFISPSTKNSATGNNNYLSKASYFNFSKWRDVSNPDFKSESTKLILKLANAQEIDKPVYRLALAKLYLKNGLLEETISFLDTIQIKNGDFWNTNPEPRILEAVAHFLMKRFAKSKKLWDEIDINDIHPKFHNELISWKAASNISFNHEYDKSQVNFLAYEDYYFTKYPDNIKIALATTDFKFKLRRKNISEAQRIIKYFQNQKFTENDHYKFLYALLLEAQNLRPEFLKTINILTKQYLNPKYRSKAIVKLTEFQLTNGLISKNDAIDQLNKIRFTWRGNESEVYYLDFLGELYWQQKQYTHAFYCWQQVINNFPNDSNSILIASKMSENYTDLILNQKNFHIDDFNLVAIFDEFQELTPIGQTGDKINRAIIAGLFRLDLLDKAATVLNTQIQYRTEKELRNRLIADYSYVQLLNKKPDQALAALNLPLDHPLDKELEREYLFLRIRALIDLNQYDQALSLIQYRTDEESMLMKMDILWQTQDWNGIKKYFDPLSEALWQFNMSLTTAQERFIAKLGIAYYMLDDGDAVNTIVKRFMVKINPDSSGYQILNFISQKRDKMSLQAIENNLGVDQFEQFINDYRQKLENQNL